MTLVRLGIGHGPTSIPAIIDWKAVKTLAYEQGLSAIVLDSVEKLPERVRPPKVELINWIGETIREYEQRYDLYRYAIADLAGWHNSHGFKMMVLKGYACAINWPKPEHRPCGDIDIWQFGKQKEADAALISDKGIKVDNSHHHHTVFHWGKFMVENHYDFLNVHHHKSNVELEAIFKNLGQDDSHFVELFGEKVYIPSPNLHALFLLRHSMSNFASTVVTMRQLMDWAYFAEANKNEIDWAWLEDMLDRFGMRKLYDIFNAICVEDLGFDADIFPMVQFAPELKNRVLNEILQPTINKKTPKNFLLRIPFKFNRWKDNGWKHRLCYKESMWSAFWSGVWSHLLKPASI